MTPPDLLDDAVRKRIHFTAEILAGWAQVYGDTPEEALVMLAAACAVLSVTQNVSMQTVGDLIAGYRTAFAAALPMLEVGKS